MSSTAIDAPRRERITFQSGIPVVVTLDYAADHGKQVTSRSGETEYMHTFGDKIAWLNEDANRALASTYADAGTQVAIVRRGRTLETSTWEAEIVATPKAATPPRAPQATRPAPRPSEPAQSIAATPSQASRIPADAAEVALTTAYMHAIEVAITAQAYAAERAMHIAFDAADIRAMAATIYISARDRAERAA